MPCQCALDFLRYELCLFVRLYLQTSSKMSVAITGLLDIEKVYTKLLQHKATKFVFFPQI